MASSAEVRKMEEKARDVLMGVGWSIRKKLFKMVGWGGREGKGREELFSLSGRVMRLMAGYVTSEEIRGES